MVVDKQKIFRKKIVFLTLLGLNLLLIIGFGSNVRAEETNAAGVGYQVEPIFSKEQIDPDKGFYYLKTIPGSEQIVEAEIISTQEEPVDVKLTVLDAFTQSNGQMGYTDKKDKLDETLKEPLSNLVEVISDTVRVQNFEKKKVKFKIKSPNDPYDGVKAGALLFSKQDKNSKGITSRNEFRIGLLLSESGDSYNDSVSLNLNKAKATVKDAKKVVSLTFQNPEPKILANLALNTTIKEKNTGKVIKTKNVENYVLAPNSNFEFDLDWGIEKIPAGDFIAEVEANNGEQSWQLKKEFTISGKSANEMNKNSAYKIITPFWLKIVTIILGIVSIIIIIIIFLRQNKREKKLKKLKKGKNKNKRRK